MAKVSVAGAARHAKAEDKKLRQQLDKAKQSFDSYQNFMAKLGMGTDNQMAFSTYGFNPVTKIRNLLEWIHRGSWMGGVAVDLVADDMTRGGVDIKGKMPPDQQDKLRRKIIELKVWKKINELIKWSRLYGGAIAVKLIDGQRMETPFDPDKVGKDQFRGLAVLDRWMVDPSLNDLITEPGPNLGLPKYYRVVAMSPYLSNQKIHYTRVYRMEGLQLPFQQRLQENLWGLSILERIYDRMVAFDSATTGAAQLVFKSYIRTYKIKDLRSNISSGGPVEAVLVKYLDMMRRFQGVEGVTVIDAEDDFVPHTHGAFSGLRDALMIFDEQLSGALQIPLVRLFGQSPAGLNSSGESDLKTYYDNVRRQQENDLQTPIEEVYKLTSMSMGLIPDDTFGISFRHLGQLGEKDKSDIATVVTDCVVKAAEAGIIDLPTAAKELKQQADQTGVFTNISDELIEQLKLVPPPDAAGEGDEGGEDEDGLPPERPPSGPAPAHDEHPHFSTPLCADLREYHNLDAVIETPKGTRREGTWGEKILSADYGFIRGTMGADGDEVDCFIGPNPESSNVFVIDQKNLRGGFDEHKIMLGYYTQESAVADFMAAHKANEGARRLGNVSECTMPQFKQWLNTGDLNRPYAAHDEARKFTKKEVKFEHPSRRNDQCQFCTMFRDSRCTIVAGTIDPDDYCNKFERRVTTSA